jgi:hypothetical protein
MSALRDCDQCVVESFNFNGGGDLPRPDAVVNQCASQCPKCQVWVCWTCFWWGHVLCDGLPEGSAVADLYAMSQARKGGDDTPPAEFYLEKIKVAVNQLPRQNPPPLNMNRA